MNLSNIEELKNLLRSSGLRPKDYLGQNFLVDEEALKAIVDSGEIRSTDTVLEVGPGLGVLPSELVKKAKEVIAVEKDDRLVFFLKKQFQDSKNLKVINEDILRFHVKKNIPGNYKVVANIPYYLTSKLFQLFLENEHPPKSLVLMIQKEVGERVVAAPGDLSILGISVQVYADAEIMRVVPKTSFWPVPKVNSVILKITPGEKYPEITDKKLFFRMLKTAFAGKRKQIKNTIKNLEAIQRSGIDPMARPQDLSIESWIALYKALSL
jgi:16S rRNA (adenine1518-N6/adenine1519-N6)-dimethyltransferase